MYVFFREINKTDQGGKTAMKNRIIPFWTFNSAAGYNVLTREDQKDEK